MELLHAGMWSPDGQRVTLWAKAFAARTRGIWLKLKANCSSHFNSYVPAGRAETSAKSKRILISGEHRKVCGGHWISELMDFIIPIHIVECLFTLYTWKFVSEMLKTSITKFCIAIRVMVAMHNVWFKEQSYNISLEWKSATLVLYCRTEFNRESVIEKEVKTFLLSLLL